MAEESIAQSSVDSAANSNQGIRELIERVFLVGVGAATLTKDRIQSIADEFVRRGQLSGEEGKDLVEKLVARSREEAHTAMQRADSSMQGTYRSLGLATKRELEDVEFRIRQLEHRMQLLESGADGAKAPD